jgi:hypothetical protein
MSSTAQSPEKEEREIEDISPKHMPIKFKVKNEEKIKDLKNERWERDLEVEVTNTGARPIYFISFGLGMPDVKGPNGLVIGFTFKYGRINLIDYTVKAEPDDIPLLPGETHVFKIREDNVKGWESVKAKYPKPKKLQFKMYSISFGDGTGLISDGTPVGGRNEVSRNNCSEGSSPPGQPAPAAGSIQTLFLPAAFRPVNFYQAGLGSSAAGGAAARDVCCPGTSCSRRKPSFYNCHCGSDQDFVESVSCDQVQWACADIQAGRTEECIIDGIKVFCPTFIVVTCGTNPTPTPTPTPTPSPTPLCTQEGCEAINPCASCGGSPFTGCFPTRPAVAARMRPNLS